MLSLELQQTQFLLFIATYILIILAAFTLVALALSISLFISEFKHKRNKHHDQEARIPKEASQSHPHAH